MVPPNGVILVLQYKMYDFIIMVLSLFYLIKQYLIGEVDFSHCRQCPNYFPMFIYLLESSDVMIFLCLLLSFILGDFLTCECILDIGLSYQGRKLMDELQLPSGICKDVFNIDFGKVNVCTPNYCAGVCASKKYKRLLSARCSGYLDCECTHTC